VKSNRYFERVESVKEFEATGSKLFEQFPTQEWEFLVAKTRPLGVFSETFIRRATFPPSPGTKVRVASKKTLERFLGLDLEKGLMLGEIEHHDVSVRLNLSRLFQKHLAILAMSGAGKSYLVSVLLEELLQRKKKDGRLAVLVMDAHGEYRNFADPASDPKYKDFSSNTKYVKASEIKIGVPKLSASMIASIVSSMSGPQKRDLDKIFSKLQGEMKDGLGPFDFNAVKSEIIKSQDIKDVTKQALIGWIISLEQLNLFGKTDNPSINDLVRPGELTIIDLSDIVDLKKKQIIVAYFARKLFNERRNNRVAPFTMVVEEAHQFCPEGASREAAISRSIIETIAREGRKFGASICLISQRPINLSTTALSQCNTHIIMRVTNPYDLKHIGETSEGLDSRSLDMITTMRTGEALLVGEAVNYPVFFKVRKRFSQDSRHEKSLEQSSLEFEELKAEAKKEIEDLL
ncbi:MAG TPA: ATP-binding protein, partial [archaeon]|nr:ATP-binding protein [archaeon]